MLDPETIAGVLSEFPVCRRNPDIEITLEANPEDVTSEWAAGARKTGANRLSLGVQSLGAKALETIHRAPPESVFEALRNAFSAGFSNVNIDFILGLPHVAPGATLGDIRTLHETFPGISHTSAYFLEKGDYPREWTGLGTSDAQASDEYAEIRRFLVEERGFSHYEISNFAQPGSESRHNRAYWTHREVRGFGLAGASFLADRRFENAASFAGYYRGETTGEESLSPESLRLERAMFGLRTFSLDPSLVHVPEEIPAMVASGLLRWAGDRLFPTPA